VIASVKLTRRNGGGVNEGGKKKPVKDDVIDLLRG